MSRFTDHHIRHWNQPLETPPRREDKVWDGTAWVHRWHPEVTQRTIVTPDVSVSIRWAEGQQGQDGIPDAVRDYMTLVYSLQPTRIWTCRSIPAAPMKCWKKRASARSCTPAF